MTKSEEKFQKILNNPGLIVKESTELPDSQNGFADVITSVYDKNGNLVAERCSDIKGILGNLYTFSDTVRI